MHRQRLGTIPLLVLTAVVALLFGSVGSATASGLTKGAVKKIAAKVVKKQAPTLSVAHAATADSATAASSLGGFTAGQLRTTGYRYTLPIQAAAGARTYTFPGLPAGNYLATYAFTANVTSATPLDGCSFQIGAGNLEAPSYSVALAPSFIRESASAIVTVAPGFALTCSGTAFAMNAFNEDNVSFVPIDTQVPLNATGTRQAAGASAAGTP
jgi:hypothetical protein